MECVLNRNETEAVLFDAVGTLITVHGSVGAIYSSIAARHGAQIEPQILDSAFRSQFAAESSEEIPAQPDSAAERRWWSELVKRVLGDQIPESVFEQYFGELYEHFRHADAWLLYPDVESSLVRLRTRKFRLGIISNFDSRLLDVLNELGVLPWFEQVIVSWSAGAAKPDPRIFRKALDKMKVPAHRAIYIGDSLRDDVEGSAAAGLTPILLDRRGKHAGWNACRRIRSLAEL
jgi:putative hydrolase of the HAD superfamily